MNFEEEWERCSPWIAAALEYAPTHNIDDVFAEIVNGQAQFWPGRNAAMVTQINVYPRLKVADFWLAGGDMRELVDEMRPVIEKWASAQGCQKMITPGRFGWARILKPEGYKPVWAIIAKDIEL